MLSFSGGELYSEEKKMERELETKSVEEKSAPRKKANSSLKQALK